jgi:hypothetical protein
MMDAKELRDFFRREMGLLEGCLDFAPNGRKIVSSREQDAMVEYRRDELCWLCGARFDQHFLDVDHLDEELQPFLRTLCDGSVVKIARSA